MRYDLHFRQASQKMLGVFFSILKILKTHIKINAIFSRERNNKKPSQIAKHKNASINGNVHLQKCSFLKYYFYLKYAFNVFNIEKTLQVAFFSRAI